MPLPQDPYRRAQQEQAAAEDLVAQQQRDAERLAHQQARRFEQEQKAAADAARKAELSKQELEMRAKGMIPVTTADGNLHEDPLFEQKQAEKAAKEKRDAEAAQLSDQFTREGRKFFTSKVTGLPVPLESDAQLEEQRKLRADKARRSALDERIQALETTATDPTQKRLPQKARVNLVNQVKKVIQENALPALQTSLQERAKAVSGGADWIPFNETATEDAQKAQQHLQRLQNLDPSNPDLTEEDFALLESNDATKPFVDKIRNARAILARDDEAAKFHEQTDGSIFDLKLRRDNPAAWAERQRQRRAGMTPEQLATDLESSSADLTARGHSLNDAFAPIQARRTATQQKLDDLRQQAALRRQQGLTAGEMVTMTNPDGTTETWPADLAAQFEKEQALHQQAEAQDAPILERIIAQRDELLADEALHNEAATRLNEVNKVSQVQQAQSARRRFAFTPGMEQTGQALDALASEAQTRQQVLAEMHPEGIPQEALDALNADIQSKTEALITAGEAKLQGAAQAAAQIRQRLDAREFEGKDASPAYAEAAAQLAQQTGITPDDAQRLITDAESATDWTNTYGRHGEGDTPGQTRLLSNGGIVVNPSITDKAAYEKAVAASGGTPEAQADAIARYPQVREAAAKQVLESIQEIGSVFGPGAIADYTAYAAKRPGDLSEAEWAMRYVENEKANARSTTWNTLKSITREAWASLNQGAIDLRQQASGLLGGLTGSETLMQDAQWAGRKADALQQAKVLSGDQSTNIAASAAFSSIPRLAASILPAAKGAQALTGGVRLFAGTSIGARLFPSLAAAIEGSATPAQAAKAVDTLTRAGLGGASAAGAAQTYGAQIADIYGTLRREHPELSHADALQQAQAPAVVSALATAALTTLGGSSGVERLFTRPQEARAVFDKVFASRLQQAGFVGKEFLKDGLKESFLEELPDEMISQIAAAVGTGKPVQQALAEFLQQLPELAIATTALGGAGQGFAAAMDSSVNPDASKPEVTAPAWAAIENHVATDATGQVDQVLTEQQQRRAALALSLAQGGELFDVEAADLAAAGWTRDGDKFKPLKDYTGPQVLDIDSGGLPVIKDSYIAALRQTGLAPVADAIGMTETQTRNFYAQRNNPTTPDQNTPAGSQQPQQSGASPTPAVSRPNANPSPVQAPVGTGNEPARSGSPPAPFGDAVSDAGTPARNDSEAPATVADTLANHLAERGLDRPAAAAAAEEIAARPEFDGMSYEAIIAEGPKFRAALDDLGIAGSLNSKDVATNPLKIQPGGRLEKVKAEMEAKAEAAKAAADPFAVTPVNPVNNVTPADFATLRQQIKNREISDRDAARQVAEAVGATTHEAFVAAMQQHLGWKPLRAEIASHSHFGTKDQSSIPMASAGRASNRAVNQVTPVNQVSRDGPDTSLAADPSPLRKNRAYAADKLRVLARIKDPSKKAWARQFFTALEQSLQRHHTLYDAYAVGGPARRHLDGQMTAVLEVEGKITRLIDLDAMVAQFDYLQSPQDALRATSIEEDIHAAVLQLARENPQEYGYAALRKKWQSLPDVLKQTVWTAYRAANQNTASASEARMPKLTAAQEWHMMNEFVRMLVQDASFAGAITETVDPASGLIGWVQDLLKNLSRLLKNLMKKVQPDLRANLDRMVAQISDRLAQIEQASAAQKDRLAVLPSLRDPAAYASAVLQQLGTAENAGILSDAALARVFDQLDPALQSRVFNDRPIVESKRADKAVLMRSLLAQFLGSRADSQRLATALAGMQSPPKTTGLLTKIMDRLLDRVQAPEVLDLIAAQSPKARRDLKNLHIATLRAIGGIRAASFVHDLGTKPGLVTALEAAPVNPVNEVPSEDSETAARRRADFLAALAAREQDHEDARNDENQLKLRQRLFAEESVNPVNDVNEVLSEASRIQSRLADFLAALEERDRQIELDHRDASSPAAGPALRRKLRQEEMARAHQIAYARGEALAEIQLLTDQRRLPEPTKRLLFDLMKVAAGRFEPENQKTTSWKLAGYATEQTLQRLGLRISPQGYLLTIDPVNTVAYVERRHVIIRQDTLDTVADLVPAVAAYLHLRLGSEYDQRQIHGLPTFAKPEPQTTDDEPVNNVTPVNEVPAPTEPTFTPLAEGQSPFAANVAPVSQSPSLPVSPSPAPTARIPLGGRNSLPAQFATAEDLAAFQYQLDRDALLREGTPEKDRNAARDRITALRARLIDETGASKEEVEQKLADYHRAVIEAAKKADPVEVFRPVSFSNFLRARGTQAKADTLVAPEGGDLISALQGRVKRIGKITQSRTAGEWDWYRQLQQQVQAENAGRPLSRRQLQQAQKAAQNGDVSTPLNLLQWINLNVVDADKGMPIDEAATALSDTGKIDENDPNAQQPFDVDGTSLGEAILAAIDARVALRDQGGDPALRQEAEALRQGSDFRAVAEGAPGRAFTGSELAARLQPGDEIQLGTEWLTVTDVDTEEGTVALDSDRYGPQSIEPSQTIHLLAIGDEQFPVSPPSIPSTSSTKSPSVTPTLEEARAELRAALLEAGIQPLSASQRIPEELRFAQFVQGGSGEGGGFVTARVRARIEAAEAEGREEIPAGGHGSLMVWPDEAEFIREHGFGRSHLNTTALATYQAAKAGSEAAMRYHADRLIEELTTELGEDPSTARNTADELLQAARTAAPQTLAAAQRTPAFDRWFAGSKVVDRKGNPLIVYHRTLSEFDTFDPTLGETGIHLATDRDQLRGLRGNRTLALYARITNPLRITDRGFNNPNNLWLAAEVAGAITREERNAALTGTGNYPEWLKKNPGGNYDQYQYTERTPYLFRKLRDTLESKGYDGFVYKNRYETPVDGRNLDSYIALRPEQVKSATDNSGAFDPSQPSFLAASQRLSDRLTPAIRVNGVLYTDGVTHWDIMESYVWRHKIPAWQRNEAEDLQLARDWIEKNWKDFHPTVEEGFAEDGKFLSREVAFKKLLRSPEGSALKQYVRDSGGAGRTWLDSGDLDYLAGLPVSSTPPLASSPRIRAAAATYADRAFAERGKRTFPDFLAFVAGDLPDFFPYLKTPHLRSAWNTLMAEKGQREVTAAEEATALRPYAPKIDYRPEPDPETRRRSNAVTEESIGIPTLKLAKSPKPAPAPDLLGNPITEHDEEDDSDEDADEDKVQNLGSTELQRLQAIDELYGPFAPGVQVMETQNQDDETVPHIMRGRGVMLSIEGKPHVAIRSVALPSIGEGHAPGVRFLPLAGDKSNWTGHINKAIQIADPDLDEHTDVYIEPYGGGLVYLQNLEPLLKTSKPVLIASSQEFEPDRNLIYTTLKSGDAAALADIQSVLSDITHQPATDAGIALVRVFYTKSKKRIVRKLSPDAAAQLPKLAALLQRPNVKILPWNDVQTFQNATAMARAGKRVTLLEDSNYADLYAERTKDQYKGIDTHPDMFNPGKITHFIGKDPRKLLAQKLPVYRAVLDAGGTVIATNNMSPALINGLLAEFGDAGHWFGYAHRTRPVPDGFLRHPDGKGVLWSTERPEYLAILRKGVVNPPAGAPKYGTDTPAGLDYRPGARRLLEDLDRAAQPRRTPSPHTGGSLEAAESLRGPTDSGGNSPSAGPLPEGNGKKTEPRTPVLDRTLAGGPGWDRNTSAKVAAELDADRAAANERDGDMMAQSGIYEDEEAMTLDELEAAETERQRQFYRDLAEDFDEDGNTRPEALAASNRRVEYVEPGFYSALAEAIRTKMPARGTPAQILGILKNAGLKMEEIKWTGIRPWLEAQAQDGPITQQQVLDYLATEGSVKFTITRLGYLNDRFTYRPTLRPERNGQGFDVISPAGEFVIWEPTEASAQEAVANMNDGYNRVNPGGMQSTTRNTQWTLPGGTNPKEVVVTWRQTPNAADLAPGQAAKMSRQELIQWYQTNIFDDIAIDATEQEVSTERLRELYVSNVNLREQNKRPSLEAPVNSPNDIGDTTHYGDLDALAWYRTTDRTNAAGNGLLVEEFQSKWHQRGREEGYRGERKFTVEPDPAMPGQMWLVKDPQGNTVNFGTTEAEAQRWADAYAKESGAIPDAPYRASWPLMLFKRALLDAVQSGKSWIGWTTGDTQADRYDLSKRIDAISVRNDKEGTYEVTATQDGKRIIHERDLSPVKLAETIGKELAAKAIERLQNGGVDAAEKNRYEQDWQKLTAAREKLLKAERDQFGRNMFLVRPGQSGDWEVYTPESEDRRENVVSRGHSSERRAWLGVPDYMSGFYRRNTGAIQEALTQYQTAYNVLWRSHENNQITPDATTEWATFSGLDLKVGGDGMRKFYDDILVKEFGKYAKQLGGGQVEQGHIPLPDPDSLPDNDAGRVSEEFIDDGRVPIHLIRITPAMREAVTAGQALFASARITDPPFSTPEAKALEESRIHAIDAYLHGKRRPIAETPPADQARSSRAQLSALLTHLRRSQRTGGSSAPDAAARRAADRRRDKALLTDWARDAGILITVPPSRYDLDGPLDKGGAEHHVFRDNEGRWVKITRGDGTSYGYQPRVYRDEWDIARDGADAASYLEKLLLHNHTFHDDIVLHAVWSDRVGNVALITSQPHYQGAYAPQETAIKPAMEDAGFIQLDLPSAYYRPADNLAVLDLHTENAITQDNGTFLRVFDNIILHPTGALRTTFERLAAERSKGLAASNRTPTQAIEATGLAPAISVKGKPYTGRAGMTHGSILGDYVWRNVFTPQQRRDDPNQDNAVNFAYDPWMDTPGSGFDDFGFLDTRSGKFLNREEAYTLLKQRGFSTPPGSYSTTNESLDSYDLFNSQPVNPVNPVTEITLPAAQRVAAAASQTDPNPSDAQKRAGNYAKGKVDLHGLRISIENPAGSVRSGTDAAGKPWSITLPHHYGYILGSEGRDGDHVDVFIGPNPDSQLVLIINQRKPGNGHFDEHKIMLGFNTPAEAARGYMASYTKGWQGLQSAVPTTIPVFKHWLTTKDTTQPVTKEQLEKLAKTLPLPQSAHDQSPVTEVNPVNPVPLAASSRTPAQQWAHSLPDAHEPIKTAPNAEEDGTRPRTQTTPFIEGALTAEHYGEDPYIYRNEYIDPRDYRDILKLEGLTYEQVVKMPSTQKYIQWYREGHLPPPVTVVIRDHDKRRYATDRRRMVAALEAGIHRIPAQVEIGRASELAPTLAASNRLGTAITKSASAVATGTERTLQVANTLTEALGIQQPFATFGSNNLDKKIAAQLDKLAGPKIRSAKTAVETWLDKPDGLAPSIKGLVDQILPTALLPREWLALHHEMQRKTAYGQETANDLIRALSGNPRLSDLAYPKEFAENPAARAQLFDAMEGRIPMATLPPAMQRLGQRLRDLLRQTGSELVRQGLMNPDTFEELQSNGWMPRYTEDEARESAGSFLAAFKLGVRDLLQQRSTAYHIVDTTRKDKTGQFVTVSRDEGGKRNRWRFRDAASRDAFYHQLIRQHALAALQEDNKHPHTKTLLDALDAKTRREVRADIKKLTAADMELTAKVSPALARLIKSALHYQADRFLPKDPFEPAKLVKDPVYAVARYVLGQTHNASTMELLKKTAAHPEWVSDVSLTGFTAIPDASRFGPLAGKFVRKDIAAQILDLVDVPNAGLQFYDAILRKWKAGKLVWNPGSHVRDAVGNTMFAYLAGSSIWNPGNWPYYQQAIAALRTGGADFAELIEQQVIGGDAYTGLVKERLKGLLPDPKTVEDYNPGLVQRLLFGFGASLHGSHEFLASLRRLPDDLFKSAAYFKAKAEAQGEGLAKPLAEQRAAAHVRKWFPYYDRLGQSGTTRAVGRFVNPFVSFFRESTRILGTAVAERPLALTASLAFPAIITALSAMALGLDDDDMEQIQKDMAGKGKLFATDTPLFSMLLPFRSAQGAVQQFDISAIMPFADLLGTRVAVTDATEDPWNRFWRGIVAGGPVLSLIDAWRHNEDAFTRRPIAEFGMTPLEKIKAYTKHAAGVALPPLAPGGTAFNTLTRAGDRATNKTLETYDPAQAVVRAVAGLNVKNATPDLYRLADDWRKAHGYEVTEGMDYGSTTPASRARKALFAQLAQDEPNLTAIGNILKRLADMGHPVRTEQDVNKLLFYRDPLKLIGGNKAKGISPQDAQAQFRASLQGEARQALESALQEFQRIKQRAPALIRRAASSS